MGDKMKKIEEVVFDKDLSIKYKNEIEEINNLCKELDNDKSIQRLYKKYLKTKKKRKFNYNKFNVAYTKKEIPNNSLKMNISNKENYVTDVQFEERFG